MFVNSNTQKCDIQMAQWQCLLQEQVIGQSLNCVNVSRRDISGWSWELKKAVPASSLIPSRRWITSSTWEVSGVISMSGKTLFYKWP